MDLSRWALSVQSAQELKIFVRQPEVKVYTAKDVPFIIVLYCKLAYQPILNAD